MLEQSIDEEMLLSLAPIADSNEAKCSAKFRNPSLRMLLSCRAVPFSVLLPRKICESSIDSPP
jgi:hypothetical protein